MTSPDWAELIGSDECGHRVDAAERPRWTLWRVLFGVDGTPERQFPRSAKDTTLAWSEARGLLALNRSSGKPDSSEPAELARLRATLAPMPSDVEEAWEALHDATPPGWYVGRPMLHDERHEWQQYAFDPSERAVVGVRKREWTAVAQTEAGVVREMARRLTEIREGRISR